MRYLMTGQDYFYKTTPDRFDIWKCIFCGFERIWPLPDEDKIKLFYPNNYYSFDLESSSFSRIKKKMASCYYDRSPPYFGRLAAKIFNHFLFLGLMLENRGNNNFLDVGCGDGHDVRLMEKFGWNSFGFEAGESNKNSTKRIITGRSLKDEDFGGIKFDYIRIWQVLEHIADPDEMLDAVVRLMADGGKIIIGVPNSSGLWAKIFGKFWFGRDVPRHLINFNDKNIKIILEKHKIRIEKMKYQSLNGFAGSLQNLVNGAWGKNVKIFDKRLVVVLLYPFEFICNVLGISDAIVIIAKK